MSDILKIVDGVLEECTDKGVTSVEIPAGVTRIARAAFRHCRILQSVIIPQSVTEIGVLAFENCRALQSAEIPEGVTKIEGSVFSNCYALRFVALPYGLKEIGDYAFSSCFALEDAKIPESVTQIGEFAFYRCCALRSVSIPCGVRKISADAFNGCSSLSSLSIADGVLEIGDGAFGDCTSLSLLSIPESVTKIGYGAFADCGLLSSVLISESTEIGEYAFTRCAISQMNHPSLTVKNGVAFRNGLALYLAKPSEDVVIPDEVTEIDEMAFEMPLGEKVKTITFGDHLERVSAKWFKNILNDYEIVCTEGSATFKAFKKSKSLAFHVKALKKEILKTKKSVQIQKTGVEAVIASLLEGVADADFKVLSSTKTSETVFVRAGCNTALLKLDTGSQKWISPVKECAAAMRGGSRTSGEIYEALLKADAPYAVLTQKLSEMLRLTADSSGKVRLFCKGGTLSGKYVRSKGTAAYISPMPIGVRRAELFGVTEIGSGAFYGCASLESVLIPKGVKSIDAWAFGGCKNLLLVEFGGTVAEWGAVIINGGSGLESIGTKCAKCTDGEAEIKPSCAQDAFFYWLGK